MQIVDEESTSRKISNKVDELDDAIYDRSSGYYAVSRREASRQVIQDHLPDALENNDILTLVGIIHILSRELFRVD